jgi:hypothetical protein
MNANMKLFVIESGLKHTPGAFVHEVDLDSMDGQTRVGMYPNPAIGLVHLDLGSFDTDRFEVTVFDAVGRNCKAFSLVGGSAHRIDLTELTSGVYTIVIASTAHRETHRLVVKRW